MGIAAGCHLTDGLAALQNRLVADDLDLGVHDERNELLRRLALAVLQRGCAADEVMLVVGNEAIEAGLVRGIVGAKLAHECAVALLKPQRHQRTIAEVLEPEVAACLDELVVERHLVIGRDPYLVAEVARVARADDGRRA